jgi:hypothetical protein
MNLEPIVSWLADSAIALLALLIAGWSAFYTYKYSGKSVRLQEEALEMEKKKERKVEEDSKKAILEPEFLKSGNRAKPVINILRIYNRGKADAKNVQIHINGKPIYEYPGILNRERYKENAFKIISGQMNQFKIAVSKESEKVWMLKFIWDDRAGKDNKEEFELVL